MSEEGSDLHYWELEKATDRRQLLQCFSYQCTFLSIFLSYFDSDAAHSKNTKLPEGDQQLQNNR